MSDAFFADFVGRWWTGIFCQFWKTKAKQNLWMAGQFQIVNEFVAQFRVFDGLVYECGAHAYRKTSQQDGCKRLSGGQPRGGQPDA